MSLLTSKALKRNMLLNLRPLRDKRFDKKGVCIVCGENVVFRYSSWSIDKKLLRSWANTTHNDEFLFRESMFCVNCFSSKRVRLLASVIISHYSKNKINSVKGLLQDTFFQTIKILSINTIGSTDSFSDFIKSLTNLYTTTYNKSRPMGEVIDGLINQDIKSLTFENNDFDLVIHSDTLEHIFDYEKALSEIYRVLKPGGASIFTVPIHYSEKEIVNKFDNNDRKKPLRPIAYHGKGAGPFSLLPNREDFIEVTLFSEKLVEVLKDLGFAVQIFRDSKIIWQSSADFVFKAVKI